MEEEQVVFEPGSWQDNFMKMSEEEHKGLLNRGERSSRSAEAARGKTHTVSAEAREAISRGHMGVARGPMSEEQKRKISESTKRTFSEKVWTEDESLTRSRANSERWASYTEEKRKAVKDRNSESNKEHWDGLSKEEYGVWYAAKVEGEKRAKLEGKGRLGSPNADEFFLGIYLEKRFPGEWAFNGSYNQGITIGRKVPDFVNINGKKEVVEMFGHHRHPDWHEKAWVEHYAKYGFKCTVVWEEYTDSDEELDKIFGYSNGGEGV